MTSSVLTPTFRRRRRFRPPPPISLPSPPPSLPPSFYDAVSPPQPPTLPLLVDHLWPGDHRSAAASTTGARHSNNEDRVFVAKDGAIVGVCDGHGGMTAAEFVAKRYPQLIHAGLSTRDAFLKVDRETCENVAENGFLGSTLITVEVVRGEKLIVAHVGDSRAMVVDALGRAATLTNDHSPNRPDERNRIEKMGGCVIKRRVNGVLSVSRAIGDTAIKSLVVAEPDITEYALAGNEQLLIVASDGMWKYVTEQQVTDYLASLPLQTASVCVPINLAAAARGLVDIALQNGSHDDTTVVLVDLRAQLDCR